MSKSLYTQTDLLNLVLWLKPNDDGFRHRVYRWLRKSSTGTNAAMALRRQFQQGLAEYSRHHKYDFVQDGLVRILSMIESYTKKLYFKEIMPRLMDKYGLYYHTGQRRMVRDLELKWDRYLAKTEYLRKNQPLKMEIKRLWEKDALKAAY